MLYERSAAKLLKKRVTAVRMPIQLPKGPHYDNASHYRQVRGRMNQRLSEAYEKPGLLGYRQLNSITGYCKVKLLPLIFRIN